MVKGSRAYRRPRAQKTPEEIGNFIRQWRERPTDEYPNGMSQEALEAASGVSVSSISAYERGDNDPSVDALKKLSDALGVDRGMLLDINPEEDSELWAAYMRADAKQREVLSRLAASLIGPPKRRK